MKRVPRDASMSLIAEAMRALALNREPAQLLVGYYSEVLERVNALRAEQGFAPITDSGLRQYMDEIRGEETSFSSTGSHGPLVMDLTPDVLDELIARQIGGTYGDTAERAGND